MKKFFLFTATCCMLGLAAQAQSPTDLTRGQTMYEDDPDTSIAIGMGLPTQKGSSLIGANILIAQLDGVELSDENSMHYRLGMVARYGYFLANNFALGGQINSEIDGFTRINQYTITAGGGVFARLYTGKAADKHGELNKFRFFVEAGTGYAYVFDRYASLTGGDASLDYGAIQVHGMPGINYFANRNVAFELGLMYGYQHTVQNEDMNPDDYHTLRLSIGMQVFFCRKK